MNEPPQLNPQSSICPTGSDSGPEATVIPAHHPFEHSCSLPTISHTSMTKRKVTSRKFFSRYAQKLAPGIPFLFTLDRNPDLSSSAAGL